MQARTLELSRLLEESVRKPLVDEAIALEAILLGALAKVTAASAALARQEDEVRRAAEEMLDASWRSRSTSDSSFGSAEVHKHHIYRIPAVNVSSKIPVVDPAVLCFLLAAGGDEAL